jgi:hypothetical protein
VSRVDRILIVLSGIVVIVVPVPLLLLGHYPAAWRWRGVLATDVVGFAVLGVSLARSVWRVHRARRLALRLEAEAEAARRRLDRVLLELAARRRRGPLS